MLNKSHRISNYELLPSNDSNSKSPPELSNSIIQEMKLLFRLSWPLMFVGMFRFASPMISVIICGKFPKIQFDAVALANSIISVFGTSIDLGFSTACDTLFSQAYGKKNKKVMGNILQRAMIIMTIIYGFLCCIHINIEPILILLKQDFQITKLTARYVLLYLPGLFFDFQFLALSRYLQNQNISLPIMISAFTGTLFSSISQYVAIYGLGFEIYASAILQASGCFVMFLTQLIYIIASKVYVETWNGFNIYEALRNWLVFFKYGIPGIIMLSVEQWAYESLNFIAGSLSAVQLAGQTIAFQVEMFLVTISISIGVVVLIRVGQNLGSKNIKNIKQTMKAGYIFSMLFGSLNFIIILFGRYEISKIFTKDQDVLALGSQLMIIVSFFQIIDAICCVSGGVLRACGKQMIGAIIMFFSYFGLGIPCGLILVFIKKTDVTGMWLGLVSGFVFETLLFIFLVLKTNWTKEINKVHKSESKSKSKDEDAETEESNLSENCENDSSVRMNGLDVETEALLIKNKRKLSRNEKSKIIKFRSIQLGFIILIFLAAVLLRVFLPPSVYIPCVEDILSNSTRTQILISKHYPLCNDSKIFF